MSFTFHYQIVIGQKKPSLYPLKFHMIKCWTSRIILDSDINSLLHFVFLLLAVPYMLLLQ